LAALAIRAFRWSAIGATAALLAKAHGADGGERSCGKRQHDAGTRIADFRHRTKMAILYGRTASTRTGLPAGAWRGGCQK